MKSIQNLTDAVGKKIIIFCLFMQSFVWGLYLKAQEEGGDLDVNVDIGAEETGGAWYTAWWIWVVGIALFIIIIVAIVSAGRTRER